MMVRLTKAFIIKALEKERPRIRTGYGWLGLNSRIGYRATVATTLKREDCAMCAVGAVMVNAINPTSRHGLINDAAGAATDDYSITAAFYDSRIDIRMKAKELLGLGKPMNALSVLFEGLSDHCDSESRVVSDVIAFVRNHFPPSVVVDIDGARPAKDVKIVKERSSQ